MEIFTESLEAKAVADPIIQAFHAHLVHARMAYLFTDRVMRKMGKTVLGKALKTGGILGHFSEADFVLIFSKPVWDGMADEKRRALVDHVLMHCAGTTDKVGGWTWTIHPHDLEEFNDIIRRHGLWRIDIEEFVRVADQHQGLLPFDRRIDVSDAVPATAPVSAAAGVAVGE
jgi:hypothetical protein